MGQKILVVDTKGEDLCSLGEVLCDTGAQVIQARTEDEALAASRKDDFILAVLDMRARGKNGCRLAELLRSEERTRSLPILFLSKAYSEDCHAFRGFETGPVDFMTKPYHPKALLSKVNVFLQLDRQRSEFNQYVEQRCKQYLEAILMSMMDPVIILSPEGIIQNANEASLSLLGYEERSELLGSFLDQHLESAGKTCAALCFADPTSTDHSDPQGIQNVDVLLKTKEGARIPALFSSFALKDKGGKMLGTVLLVKDSLERKRMEETLNAYMCKLEQSNRELQAFATVASHDLQEPLRKIKAFGDLLISKHGKNLNDEARDFIERMRSAADRMQILMESLLTYSRVTTKAEPFTRVDLNQVLQEVLIDLEWRIKQTGAKVQIKDLGIVEAEPNQMHQLFQNLLGNALKFHGEQQPVVKIYAKQSASRSKKTPEYGFCRIYVEDNGIGFDEKDLDRIFAPFQRLHGRHEYEGTGMGLAICNRIVERHGGSIKAWSSPGHGATFVVTLPLRQNQEENDKSAMDLQLSLYEAKANA